MREGAPSQTAIWVAFARGLATEEHELSAACNDDVALTLLPKRLARLLRSREGKARNQSLVQLLRAAGLGLVEHLALRTWLIDQALKQALADGIDQVVLLGAGLDGRAYRIDEARQAVVFEVDHPSTQAYKQRHAQGLVPRAKQLRYAACDFEKVSLSDALSQAGFDRNRKSVWIWEGVTMYLDQSAIEHTLDTIQSFTAQGSVLIMSYVTPKLSSRGAAVSRLGSFALSAVSEPLKCCLESATLRHELYGRGFEVLSDQLPLDVSKPLGVSTAHAFVVPDERIAVAKRIDDPHRSVHK